MLYSVLHNNLIFLEMSEDVKVVMKLFQLLSLMGELVLLENQVDITHVIQGTRSLELGSEQMIAAYLSKLDHQMFLRQHM